MLPPHPGSFCVAAARSLFSAACIGGPAAARGAVHAASAGRGAKFSGNSAFSAGSDNKRAKRALARRLQLKCWFTHASGGTSRVACGIGR